MNVAKDVRMSVRKDVRTNRVRARARLLHLSPSTCHLQPKNSWATHGWLVHALTREPSATGLVAASVRMEASQP